MAFMNTTTEQLIVALIVVIVVCKLFKEMEHFYLLMNAVELAESVSSSNVKRIKSIIRKKQRRHALLIETPCIKKKIAKTENFCSTISKMEDYVFYSHFRMRKETFKKLEHMLRPMWSKSSNGRTAIPLYKAMYITIWKLSNNNTFREVSDRFGVGLGAAHNVFIRVIKLLCRLKHHVIKFPKSPDEQRTISEEFAASRRNPFPFVLGCIDGTHIPITRPLKDSVSFYNRKGTFSIIAQAVVDSQMKFIDVCIGYPGRCHDASIWGHSSLKKAIDSGEIRISGNMHFLGDGAYPLDMYMMVPYRDNGYLNPVQSKFNTILSSTRVFVEQAFGILKKKFRILKLIEVQRQHLPKLIVMACMILHNIIIINEGCTDNNDANIEEGNVNNNSEETASTARPRAEALAKRDAIATLLSA